MTKSAHNRAKDLIASSPVEGIVPGERAWLDAHLEECRDCAGLARATTLAIQSLRSISVSIDPTLVDRTRVRLCLRANQLSARQPTMIGLWVLCAMSWICIVASASYLWRGFEWAGRALGLPDLMWQSGFALWWTLPIVLGIAALNRSKAFTGE